MNDLESQLQQKLCEAIVAMDEGLAIKLATTIVEQNFDRKSAIDLALVKAMAKVGVLYDTEEYFIPDLLVCADAMTAALDILREGITEPAPSKGRIVIGTIEGDTHDLGKNIVAIFLEAAGFTVLDLGRDVSARMFIDQALIFQADIIAISTLMTTTMDNMKTVIDLLKEKQLRSKFKVIIGGKPVSKIFARQIGADDYAESAAATVRLAEEFISPIKPPENDHPCSRPRTSIT